jgi:hypothetical protein
LPQLFDTVSIKSIYYYYYYYYYYYLASPIFTVSYGYVQGVQRRIQGEDEGMYSPTGAEFGQSIEMAINGPGLSLESGMKGCVHRQSRYNFLGDMEKANFFRIAEYGHN